MDTCRGYGFNYETQEEFGPHETDDLALNSRLCFECANRRYFEHVNRSIRVPSGPNRRKVLADHQRRLDRMKPKRPPKMRRRYNPSFSISGESFYCACVGCTNEVTTESGLCYFCREANCMSHGDCQAKRFQGLVVPRPSQVTLGNLIAREGYDRCECGCKYWENDRCIDCGKQPPRSRRRRNPWSASDVARKNKSCASRAACRRKWPQIANAVLRESGDEGKAIRIANWQVKQMGLRRRNPSARHYRRRHRRYNPFFSPPEHNLTDTEDMRAIDGIMGDLTPCDKKDWGLARFYRRHNPYYHNPSEEEDMKAINDIMGDLTPCDKADWGLARFYNRNPEPEPEHTSHGICSSCFEEQTGKKSPERIRLHDIKVVCAWCNTVIYDPKTEM